MLTVFDCPVLPRVDGQVAGACEVRGEAGDAVGDLLGCPTGLRWGRCRGGCAGPGRRAASRFPSAGAVRMVRFSRRPWPLPWSVQVVSANCPSVPVSLVVMASRRDGWFALMTSR